MSKPLHVALITACMALSGLFAGSFAQGAEPPSIALLCTGSTNDGGWNQLAKEGVDRLAAVGGPAAGATTTVLQKVGGDAAGADMRDLLADGYGVIIAHGYEFLTPATEVAKSMPAARIAVSGADVARPGIITIDFDVSQASYQLGVIAGTLTKTGKLGYIGGAPFPSVKACYRGFLAGARSVRPDVTVAEAYTSWDQVAQNKAQAEAFIAQGIDHIYPNVDAAARGVYEAVGDHNRSSSAAPVFTYGCVGDANANRPAGEWTLASAIIRLDNAFAHVVDQARSGTWKPGVLSENLATGTCVAVLNPATLGILGEPLQAAVAKAGTDLIAGTITIP